MSRTLIQTLLRIVALVFGLLLLGAGGYVLLHAFGVLPGFSLGPSAGAAQSTSATSLMFNLDQQTPPSRLFWVLGGAGSVLLGLLLLGLATKRSAESRTHRVVLSDATNEAATTYGGGRVTVTEESLRALVSHVANRVDGVREAHPSLTLRDGGWHCRCPVTVLPTASLPAVTKELKTRLHESLEHHTGLPVQGVDVDAQLKAQNARRRLQ